MVGQVCLWMVFLILFGTTVTFIRLVSLFLADIASSLEAIVLAFWVLAFAPRSSFLPLQAFRTRRFPL